MPSLPEGDPAPLDGALPAQVGTAVGRSPAFGVYLHVPFCVRRCGYCDFNTYTPGELQDDANDLTRQYLTAAHSEIALAARVLADRGLPGQEVATIFVGGGTPTMLAPDDLIGLIEAVRTTWGLADDAEISTEANPDSVTPQSLRALAAGGFTRVSFGMQSSVGPVLATLDRTHDPRRLPEVVGWARDAGLAVSLDLIYGTPGESVADWQSSLTSAIALEPEHLSAYSLTVEDGTALAGMVRRGLLAAPDPDDQATKYELADDLLTAAGYRWYEVSNWARDEGQRCRHNLGYWRGDDWWGVGPGAHSHVRGVRWWNVKHPRRYADLLSRGSSPAAGREVLDAEAIELERLMLGLRLVEGLPVTEIPAGESVASLGSDGLLEVVTSADPEPVATVRLTRRGRLLADLVVRRLLGWD